MRRAGYYNSWTRKKIKAVVEAAHDHVTGGPALQQKNEWPRQ